MRLLIFAFAIILYAQPLYAQENIGIPCSDKGWYARQPWDMQIFDGQLFVGCGNSSNQAPDPNAGPITIWSYNDLSGWQGEYVVDEEQIDRFVVVNGLLAIPGHDSRDSQSVGNWYVRGSDGTWTKYANIPNAAHVYDLLQFDQRLFAAIATRESGEVAVSTDGGLTWTEQYAPQGAVNLVIGPPSDCTDQPTLYASNRVYALFNIGADLFANVMPLWRFTCTAGKWRMAFTDQALLVWNGESFELSDANLFGSLEADRIVRPVVFHDQTIYIAATTVNDHQWTPLGLFSVSADLQAQAISPSACGRPQDAVVENDMLYVLCNEPSQTNWRISVQVSCDAQQFTEVRSTESAAFGRSLAVSEQDIYVGLGVDTDAGQVARDQSGRILRWQLSQSVLCPA